MPKFPLSTALTLLVGCRLFAAEPQADLPSLKDASDAEILRFMADGKNDYDVELDAMIKSQLPENFWTADAKAAALAFVEVNRTPEHKVAYTLLLDAATQTSRPERCTITLANFSAR